MLASARNHPWKSSIIIFLIWLVITLNGPFLRTLISSPGSDIKPSDQIFFHIAAAASIILLIIGILGWWKETGIRTTINRKNLLLLWPPVGFILTFYALAVWRGLPAGVNWFFVTVNLLLIGLSEEAMFRGILFFGASTRFGVRGSIWLTAGLFGLAHAFNGLGTGSFSLLTLQSCAAFLSGVWLGAIRLRVGNLIPVILLHAFWDLSLFALAGGFPQPMTKPGLPILLTSFGAILLIQLPLFAYGLFIMRTSIYTGSDQPTDATFS